MELIFETLNLGNNENPRLIKIGSTLNEKEREDLKELLTEFQVEMAISTYPASTQPGPIKNKAGFGFKKKKKTRSGTGFYKNSART